MFIGICTQKKIRYESVQRQLRNPSSTHRLLAYCGVEQLLLDVVGSCVLAIIDSCVFHCPPTRCVVLKCVLADLLDINWVCLSCCCPYVAT